MVAKVSVIPGDALGSRGRVHLRICYANSYENVVEGFGRIEGYLKELGVFYHNSTTMPSPKSLRRGIVDDVVGYVPLFSGGCIVAQILTTPNSWVLT